MGACLSAAEPIVAKEIETVVIPKIVQEIESVLIPKLVAIIEAKLDKTASVTLSDVQVSNVA